MKHPTRKIDVMEEAGIYRVPADFESGFVLVPSPEGTMKLAFWEESRLHMFLENYGLTPVIHHSTN
ncbi:MAG: hypothetical protein HZA07_02790 [Nitrospirae bacterium]|nr:hypothetical protein [Nitrospirota bacterium]